MKYLALTFFAAAAAIGSVSIGSASAMPFNGLSAGAGESRVQDARYACNRYGRCSNTYGGYRAARPYHAPRYNGGYYGGHRSYYGGNRGYYGGNGYGYRRAPRVGIGIGPFGVGVW